LRLANAYDTESELSHSRETQAGRIETTCC
jgi:hypothetical protein